MSVSCRNTCIAVTLNKPSTIVNELYCTFEQHTVLYCSYTMRPRAWCWTDWCCFQLSANRRLTQYTTTAFDVEYWKDIRVLSSLPGTLQLYDGRCIGSKWFKIDLHFRYVACSFGTIDFVKTKFNALFYMASGNDLFVILLSPGWLSVLLLFDCICFD